MQCAAEVAIGIARAARMAGMPAVISFTWRPTGGCTPGSRCVLDQAQVTGVKETMLAAYRWQYIVSGVQDKRFQLILGGMITEAQMQRISTALAPIMN